jgi:putative aldouronate transport system permease protein
MPQKEHTDIKQRKNGKQALFLEKKAPLGKRILKNKWTYVFLLPGVSFLLIFSYWPMYGLTLAFKDFKINEGILGSPWSDPIFKNFTMLMHDEKFWSAFLNTFRMGFFYIITSFPVPIILAILLNEVGGKRYKRVLQTVYTFPNFLSWVVIGGLFVSLFASDGLVNVIIRAFGGNQVDFLSNEATIRPMLYASNVWKTAGWSSILYLAAIAGINPELYEAAEVDGANRFQRIWHITWPGIKSTAVILLILAFGGIMSNGFDQILNMSNAVVQDATEVLDTYIYRKTFQGIPNYGLSTAMGLGKSIINFIFLLSANKIAKMMGEGGIM